MCDIRLYSARSEKSTVGYLQVPFPPLGACFLACTKLFLLEPCPACRDTRQGVGACRENALYVAKSKQKCKRILVGAIDVDSIDGEFL